MRSGSSITLVRLFGIRIGVDQSWFLVLFLFIWLQSGSFRDVLDGSEFEAYLTAVASVLLFFVSLILHELGHALVARRNGIGIAGIDLWLFGGLAKMTRDTESPGEEFRVTIAGPLVTLAIAVVCWAIGTVAVGGQRFWDAVELRSSVSISPALLLVSWLALVNGLLFVFNLLPAFPLDGGRLVRAIAWKATGQRSRGTRVAARMGQVFSWGFMALGLLLVIQGALVNGIWIGVIGLFIGQAARGAVAQTAFSDRIEGIRVEDIMDREPVAIPAALSIERAHDDYFLRYYGWDWFPVIDASGHYVGGLARQIAESALAGEHGALPVTQFLPPDPATPVRADASLENLLSLEPLHRLGVLAAIDDAGVLRGVVTIDQVRRALSGRLTAEPL